MALTIQRTSGFPGGCPERTHLEKFIAQRSESRRPSTEDDLGRRAMEKPLPPVSKRWKITYDAPVESFVERAQHLHFLREQGRLRIVTSPLPNEE
jgi:hypothetical protein